MKKTLYRWGYPTGLTYDYRRGPVPFTSCRRGASYSGRYLKKPRTTQERRRYFHDEITEEAVIHIRGRRKPRILPNHWDDRLRSDATGNHRSWKRHRRTQYKTKDLTRIDE